MIACFLSNISAKYYKNPSMLSRVIAKNVGDVFLRHSVYYNDAELFSELIHKVNMVSRFPVLHFPPRTFLVLHFLVLHFPILEILSLIFQLCRSVFDLFGPAICGPAFSVDPTRSQRRQQVHSSGECRSCFILLSMGRQDVRRTIATSIVSEAVAY